MDEPKENKKENKKLLVILIVLIVLSIIFVIAYVLFSKKKNEQLQESINATMTELNIEYTDKELSGKWEDYTAKITLADDKVSVEGTGVSNSETTIKISSAGTYYITGTLSDGNIVVEAGDKDDVQLVLSDCNITSTKTAPINGINCDKLTITLAENTTNTITDSSDYTSFTDTEKSEPDSAIFTKTDLVVNGTGTLKVNANYLDGIASKDGLKIINSNIEINSNDDAIRGKDYVAINNATLKLTSKGDGIKSTNDDDSTVGYIAIQGGNIEINSESDGIQAKSILNISEDSDIKITTTGEVSSSANKNDMPNDMNQNGDMNNMPNDMNQNGDMNNIPNNMNQNGDINDMPSDMDQKFDMKDMPNDMEQNNGKGQVNYNKDQTTSTESTGSSKALKAGSEISIKSANIEITSTDDAIHSNGIVIINDGEFKISSGDDGIHADTNIVINGGNIDITKSYEGIESNYIEINGGEISVIASDDGINVSGGADGSSIGGRPGQNNFNDVEDSNRKLVVNSGKITVDASGDGLDSNGSIYINGGDILVKGTTSSGDGALDYDGECVVTGGNIIVYGVTGMWQNPSTTSTQYCLTYGISANSGDKITLKNSNGDIIAEVTAEKTLSAITFSNSSIEKEKTYDVYVNDTKTSSLTANDIITSSISENGGMQGGGRMQGGKMQN